MGAATERQAAAARSGAAQAAARGRAHGGAGGARQSTARHARAPPARREARQKATRRRAKLAERMARRPRRNERPARARVAAAERAGSSWRAAAAAVLSAALPRLPARPHDGRSGGRRARRGVRRCLAPRRWRARRARRRLRAVHRRTHVHNRLRRSRRALTSSGWPRRIDQCLRRTPRACARGTRVLRAMLRATERRGVRCSACCTPRLKASRPRTPARSRRSPASTMPSCRARRTSSCQRPAGSTEGAAPERLVVRVTRPARRARAAQRTSASRHRDGARAVPHAARRPTTLRRAARRAAVPACARGGVLACTARVRVRPRRARRAHAAGRASPGSSARRRRDSRPSCATRARSSHAGGRCRAPHCAVGAGRVLGRRQAEQHQRGTPTAARARRRRFDGAMTRSCTRAASAAHLLETIRRSSPRTFARVVRRRADSRCPARCARCSSSIVGAARLLDRCPADAALRRCAPRRAASTELSGDSPIEATTRLECCGARLLYGREDDARALSRAARGARAAAHRAARGFGLYGHTQGDAALDRAMGRVVLNGSETVEDIG